MNSLPALFADKARLVPTDAMIVNAKFIMHNAQWVLRADALLISQSCIYRCQKAGLRQIIFFYKMLVLELPKSNLSFQDVIFLDKMG